MKTIDILIKNGRVIDPAQNVDEVRDIAINFGRIIDPGEEELEPMKIVDASGCYVFPGLIDFHVHSFYGATNGGFPVMLLPGTGVTAVVDAGSSGCANYGAFHNITVDNPLIIVKAFVSCFSMGLDGKILENFDPKLFDLRRIDSVRHEFPDEILGLKMRLSKGVVSDIEPLEKAIELAEQLGGMAVNTHVTNPPCAMGEIAKLMRPGDIFTHVYQGKGSTILDNNGKIIPEVLEARDRGVIFDAANGDANYSLDVCRRALDQGFLPDVISSDMGIAKLYYGNRVRALTYVMSKYISLGMSLTDIIRCTTETPARLMRMQGEIGTLAVGARGNVSICKIEEKEVVHFDSQKEKYTGHHLLIPQMTITNGKIAFSQLDFNIPDQSNRIYS